MRGFVVRLCSRCPAALRRFGVGAAIVALLAPVLGPGLRMVRERAGEVQCVSNLRQLGLALRLYANDHDGCLPHWKNRGASQESQRALKESVNPYLLAASDDVWYCPSDPHARTHAFWTGDSHSFPPRPQPYSDYMTDHFYTSYKYYESLPLHHAPNQLDAISALPSEKHANGYWTAEPAMLHLMWEDWPYHRQEVAGRFNAPMPYGRYVLFRDGHVEFMTEHPNRRGPGLE